MKHLHRLGLFSYLNIWPLVYNVESAPWRPSFELSWGVPSQLNQALASGDLDVASVSSSFYLTHQQDLVRLQGVSVSSFGPVTSVLLVYKEAWAKQVFSSKEPVSIGITDQSATSVALLRWWWAHQDKKQNAALNLTPYISAHWQQALDVFGAVLLIGDDALKLYDSLASKTPSCSPPLQLIDLAEAWCQAQGGLPFVFGVWVARKSWVEQHAETFAELEAWFAKQAACVAVPEPPRFLQTLAKKKAENGHVKSEALLNYWYKHLNFGDSSQHKQSLALFKAWLES